MRSLIFANLIILCFSAGVQADTIFGVYAGVHLWQQEYSGDFKVNELDIRPIDLKDDVDLDKDNNPTFYLAIEHPVPLLPNIMLQHVVIETRQDSTVDLYYEFNRVPYQFSEDVVTDIDLSYTALVFYYEVLDNWVSLDLGFAVSRHDNKTTIISKTTGLAPVHKFNEVFPQLYSKAQFQFPFTGLTAGAELAGINYSGNSVRKLSAYLNYEVGLGFGVTLGYENIILKLDDLDGVEADVDAKGPYLGMSYHF